MIKIFNKILWGIKPPENRSDIWFDGEVFKIYRKGEWEAITIEIDTATKIADILKDIDSVYQTKLTEGEGILLEDSKISVRRMFQVVEELPETGEYNTIYLLVKGDKELGSYTYINNKWVGIASNNTPTITVDTDLSPTSTNPVENRIITETIANINKLLFSKLEADDIATINGKKITEGGNITISAGSSYDDTEVRNAITSLNNDLKNVSSKVKDKVDKGSLATINNQSLQEGGNITTGTIIAIDTGTNVDPPEEEGGGGGSNIDPELLEGFIILSRDFNDDFNNDFTR